jgi:hypothetical protein
VFAKFKRRDIKWYFLSTTCSSKGVGSSSCIMSACCAKKLRKFVEWVNLSTAALIELMTGSCRLINLVNTMVTHQLYDCLPAKYICVCARATGSEKKTMKICTGCFEYMQQKPEGEEQADHILRRSFLDGPEVHEDCVIWLPRQPLSPAGSIICQQSSIKPGTIVFRSFKWLNRKRMHPTSTQYHMLEHLLQLGVRMICACFDIIISESITKAFIKLLQYLTQTNSIYLNKKEKL